MITYNGIVEYFREVADKHTQINSFSFGDIDDADLEKTTEYPLLHVGVTGANIDERVISYDINVMLIEIIDDKGDQKDNEKYALSNTLQILQDLQTEFLKGSSIVTPETKLTGNALSCTPITGNYNNRVVGWSSVMTIEGINESEPCNIPYAPIVKWNYTTPTTPIANINLNGTWYSATIQQQGNIEYFTAVNFLEVWKPIIDKSSYGNLNGTSYEGLTLDYSFKNTAIHFIGLRFIAQKVLAIGQVFFIKYKNITGGQNRLFKLYSIANQEFVEIACNSGVMLVRDSIGTARPLSGVTITGLTDQDLLAQNNYIVREEPLVVAIHIVENQKIHFYYSENNYAVLDTNDILVGLGNVQIGEYEDTSTHKSNFMVQEFIYSQQGADNTSIKNTIKWLNGL